MRAILATLILLCVLLSSALSRSRADALPAPGVIDTFAGGGAGDGNNLSAASFNLPRGIDVAADGSAYVADYENCRIRKITGGTVSTIAGTGVCGIGQDGIAATSSELSSPSGVAVAANGDVFIAEFQSCRVRRVSAGIIYTVAGTGTCGAPDNSSGVPAASFSIGSAVAVATSGSDVLFAENDNVYCRIRKVSAGILTTLAGNVCGISSDGSPATAKMISPWDVAVDGTGALIVADAMSCKIYSIAADTLTTLAGNGVCASVADGPALTTGLDSPRGVALAGC